MASDEKILRIEVASEGAPDDAPTGEGYRSFGPGGEQLKAEARQRENARAAEPPPPPGDRPPPPSFPGEHPITRRVVPSDGDELPAALGARAATQAGGAMLPPTGPPAAAAAAAGAEEAAVVGAGGATAAVGATGGAVAAGGLLGALTTIGATALVVSAGLAAMAGVIVAATAALHAFYNMLADDLEEFSPEVQAARAQQEIELLTQRLDLAGRVGNDIASTVPAETAMLKQVEEIRASLIETLTPTVTMLLNITTQILRFVNWILDGFIWLQRKIVEVEIMILDYLEELWIVGGVFTKAKVWLEKQLALTDDSDVAGSTYYEEVVNVLAARGPEGTYAFKSIVPPGTSTYRRKTKNYYNLPVAKGAAQGSRLSH